MKLKQKAILLCLLMVAVIVVSAGCAGEPTPYELNNKENFNVSVKFDANGGTFTTNAPVIVDSYNISGLSAGADGNVQIPLIAPNDPAREKDAFTPVKNGYFLAGWYVKCDKAADGSVTYAQPWDFASDRLAVDPNGSYTAEEPVLTLYAAWAPLFEIEFYNMETGEVLSKLSFDPTEGIEYTVPVWDTETGAMEMYKFPELDDHTFRAAFYDAAGKQPIDTASVKHPGSLDAATATVENGTMKLYVSYLEGEWYRISSARQFADNYSPNGSYELLADLDFSDETWPTAMMYGNFSGTIKGNGHTISNVTITQTDNSKSNAGLFGQLAQTAKLQDVNFENVTFTIKKGARMTGTAYGLLCGTAAEGAVVENVTIAESLLAIDSGCYFGTDDYVIGLVCGLGDVSVDSAGITCQAVGNAPESVNITVTDSEVTLEFVTQ